MFIDYEVEIQGMSAILMHNGRLNDKRDPFVKEIARFTGRGKKTDEDLSAVERIEWAGGLYHTGTAEIQDGRVTFSDDARAIIPADNLWACIIEGAKVMRLGEVAKSSLVIDDDGAFVYDGPKNLNELAANSKFTFRKRAGIKGSGVMRTRPIFPHWGCSFVASVDTEQWEESRFLECLDHAGRRKGLGDWSPRYGRFLVRQVKRGGSVVLGRAA